MNWEKVVFLHIGWTDRYAGTEVPVSGHAYLKNALGVEAENFKPFFQRKPRRDQPVVGLIGGVPALQLVLDIVAEAVEIGVVAHDAGRPLPALQHALMRQPYACRQLSQLGPKRLFLGADGERLNSFVEALGIDERSDFIKAAWTALLGNSLGDLPEWLIQFCRSRDLV